MYFKNFPKIYYAFNIKDRLVLQSLIDITRNVRPVAAILENALLYGSYNIEGDDTPEIISERLYGNPEYHWTLLLINERYNWIEDFPIPDSRLDDYVTEKYGVGNHHATHVLHGRLLYISPTGRIVDSTYTGATAISNIDFERSLNEEKRLIKIVHPKLLGVFLKDLEEAFKI